MKNNFWFNKLLSYVMRYDPPEGSANAAMTFVTPSCEGNHYYLKLKPCKRNGLMPEIGTLSEDEFLSMQEENIQKREAEDLKTALMRRNPSPEMLN